MDENKKIEVWNMDTSNDGIKDITPGDDFDPRRAASAGNSALANAFARSDREDIEYDFATKNMPKSVGWATAAQDVVSDLSPKDQSIDSGVAAGTSYIFLRILRMWFMPFSGRIQTKRHMIIYKTLSLVIGIINTIIVLFAIYSLVNIFL